MNETESHASDALIVVDIQPDFLPGGALAVPDGDAIIPGVSSLMRADGRFGTVVATQDWHPRGHVSFASEHPGKSPLDVIDLYGQPQVLWPDHCVRGTGGATLARGLPWDRADAIIRKGTRKDADTYSGFRDNLTPDGQRPDTGLAGYLRGRGVRRVYVCGLARDICVKWTAEDAAREGFETVFLWDLTRGVDPNADGKVRADLTDVGIAILPLAPL